MKFREKVVTSKINYIYCKILSEQLLECKEAAMANNSGVFADLRFLLLLFYWLSGSFLAIIDSSINIPSSEGMLDFDINVNCSGIKQNSIQAGLGNSL